MSIENARKHLEKYNLQDRIQEFDVSSATVELAAAALGCEPCNIAKSITFLDNDEAILIVTAGDMRIDNAKFKSEFCIKAKMLTKEQASTMIGHDVGGICPFGVKESVRVYLDESLKRFNKIYPACGSSNSCIELTIDELMKTSEFVKWVDVCKSVN